MTVQLIDDAHDEYVKEIERVSEKLYPEIAGILLKYSKNGKLGADPKKLAGLEKELIAAFKKAGYSVATDKLLDTLVKIEKSQEKAYSKDGFAVKPLLGADILKFIKEKAVYDLRGKGAEVNVLKPLEDIIRESVYLQRSLKQTTDLLKVELVERPYMKPYLNRTSLSTLGQYSGAISNLVRVKYGLKWFNYVGSLIEDSRPFCDHIRDMGNRSISVEELETVLAEYCPGGVPSKEKITYTTVNGKTSTREKGSGMTPGTTVETFTQFAGGKEYNCRHDVFWVRKPKNV